MGTMDAMHVLSIVHRLQSKVVTTLAGRLFSLHNGCNIYHVAQSQGSIFYTRTMTSLIRGPRVEA